MSQESRGHAHGIGRPASAHAEGAGGGDAAQTPGQIPGPAPGVQAALAREMGELTTEIKHLNRSMDTLNARLLRQQAQLEDHAERIVALEQGPTRGEIAAADAALGTRLTTTERKVAVVIGVCVTLGTLVQIALSAAKLLQGAM